MNTRIKKLMTVLKADTIREDGRLERHCKHGIGHTVGSIYPKRLTDKHLWVHGCDGCCHAYDVQQGNEDIPEQ